MKAIFERELKSYFRGVMGYLFIAFLLLFVGIYTLAVNLLQGYPNFEIALSGMSFIFLVLIPMLTMRTLAEERRQKTDQLLYSLPVPLRAVVLGKYFALLCVLGVAVGITCLYPPVLMQFGTVNLLSAYGGIFAFFMMAAALIAIGVYLSSVTENPLVAAVLCLVVMLVNYFQTALGSFLGADARTSFIALSLVLILFALVYYLLTRNTVLSLGIALVLEGVLVAVYLLAPTALEGLFPTLMEKLSIFERFYVFVNGVFDVTGIVFFASVAVFFLYLTVQAMEKRRWSA